MAGNAEEMVWGYWLRDGGQKRRRSGAVTRRHTAARHGSEGAPGSTPSARHARADVTSDTASGVIPLSGASTKPGRLRAALPVLLPMVWLVGLVLVLIGGPLESLMGALALAAIPPVLMALAWQREDGRPVLPSLR
ncbi:MAG: hypothetical protein AAF577_11830 [Pseudomonadota bacterium]